MQNKRQGFLFSLLRRILFSPRGGKISESREEYKINLNLFLFPRRILFSPRGGKISESREEYQTKYEVFVFFVEAHYSFSICVSV